MMPSSFDEERAERPERWLACADDSGLMATDPGMGFHLSQTPPAASEHAKAQSSPRAAERAPSRGKGTFFDENVGLKEPEGSEFVGNVLRLLELGERRKRKRHRSAQTDHVARIRSLLANAARAFHFRDPASVLYFRKADAEWYRDSPSWMRHGALGEAVEALADAGLVKSITGKRMPSSSRTKSWASSYGPCKALMEIAEESGVTASSIERRIPSTDLIQLFTAKPSPVFDRTKGGLYQPRKGDRIEFEPTAETMDWSSTLESINSHYRAQTLGLGLSAEELALWQIEQSGDHEHTGALYRAPETFRTDLYRVFNNGSNAPPTFAEGGRLFGGWWMSISEELRKAITINGASTVELDFSSCHPRMLYHEKGLDCPGDLYAIPEIEAYEKASGVAAQSYRAYVKWLMQVLINGRGRPAAADRPAGIEAPNEFSIRQICDLISTMHQPIVDQFGTGAGMRLMRKESDIALDIITLAMSDGWTVLSVHDSFICDRDHEEELRSLMIRAYTERLGREPVIK